MTNSPPPVQASGGLLVLWAGARVHSSVTRAMVAPRDVCVPVH